MPNTAAAATWPPGTALPPALLDRRATGLYLGGIGMSRLAEMTATGDIPSLLIGHRRFYRVSDLNQWLEAKVTRGLS